MHRLAKLVVPIFLGDEFLGVASGCGLLLEDGEVDPFLAHKVTDIAAEEIEELSNDIDTIGQDKIESTIAFIQEEIDRIVQDFEKHRSISN